MAHKILLFESNGLILIALARPIKNPNTALEPGLGHFLGVGLCSIGEFCNLHNCDRLREVLLR